MRWSAGDDTTTARGLLGAATHIEAAAMTAEKTAVLPLSRQALGSSAGPSALLLSPPGSDSRPISRSTAARPTPSSGLLITVWLVSWAARTMTCSSSATSPCSCQTRHELGSNTFLPHRSTTGATWLGSSSGISRAHTCALETPRTLRAVAKNQASLSKTSSGASPSSAPSCLASATRRSSRLSSPAPPAGTWCGS